MNNYSLNALIKLISTFGATFIITLLPILSLARGEPTCGFLFSQDVLVDLGSTQTRIIESESLLNAELIYNGTVIAKIDAVRAGEKDLRIRAINVDKAFRRSKAGSKIFSDFVKNFGSEYTYETRLGLDNETIFKEAYERISANSPKLSERERGLLALYETPAWKFRSALGLTKILKFQLEWNQYSDGIQPDVTFTVTREDSL